MYSIKVDEIRFIRDTKLDLHIDMKDFHVGDSCITGSLIHLFRSDAEINTKMDLTEFITKKIHAIYLFNISSAFENAYSFEHFIAFVHDLDYIVKECPNVILRYSNHSDIYESSRVVSSHVVKFGKE